MERTKKETSFMKIFNRGLSYVILCASIFAICYCTKSIVDYSVAKRDNKVLEQKLKDLKEENDRLEIVNSKLKDKDYFSVYVKDKYQYSSNSDSIIPIN